VVKRGKSGQVFSGGREKTLTCKWERGRSRHDFVGGGREGFAFHPKTEEKNGGGEVRQGGSVEGRFAKPVKKKKKGGKQKGLRRRERMS